MLLWSRQPDPPAPPTPAGRPATWLFRESIWKRGRRDLERVHGGFYFKLFELTASGAAIVATARYLVAADHATLLVVVASVVAGVGGPAALLAATLLCQLVLAVFRQRAEARHEVLRERDQTHGELAEVSELFARATAERNALPEDMERSSDEEIERAIETLTTIHALVDERYTHLNVGLYIDHVQRLAEGDRYPKNIRHHDLRQFYHGAIRTLDSVRRDLRATQATEGPAA